jgi:hypothetical protein
MKTTAILCLTGWVLSIIAFFHASDQRDKLGKNMHDYQLEINDGYHYTLFDNGRVVARFDTLAVPYLDSIIFKDNE